MAKKYSLVERSPKKEATTYQTNLILHWGILILTDRDHPSWTSLMAEQKKIVLSAGNKSIPFAFFLSTPLALPK